MANNKMDIFDTVENTIDPTFNLATRIDDDDAGTVYVGYATPGTLTSETSWYIVRYLTTGDETVKAWAEGARDFTKEWDERATYSYTS